MMRKNKNIIGRSRVLKAGKRGKGPVLYWMERDFRLHDNWAFLYAQQEALLREKPLIIVVAIDKNCFHNKGAQLPFLLQSLQSTTLEAEINNVGFACVSGDVAEVVSDSCFQVDCDILVTDFSPLKHKKEQCRKIGQRISTQMVEVDAHNIIPAWLASDKKEYGAYTIRPKIHRLLPQYLTDFPLIIRNEFSSASLVDEIFSNKSSVLEELPGVKNHIFQPGSSIGQERAGQFLSNGLVDYNEVRNDPTVNGQSNLSPYLHFGLLSAQRLAWDVRHTEMSEERKEAFLEELIVRRELADNFCLYEPGYDKFSGFPAWAQKSLNGHRKDKREYTYNLEQFENYKTHESFWNSCQLSLMNTNKLHGFLRMYWAKKILEWSESPEVAQEIAIYLNDTYSIDGNDPNGYAGIAWSIGGVHDRAWAEREVYGKVRYMNERGCRRKFDVDKFIKEYTTP